MAPTRILISGASGFVGRIQRPVLRASFPRAVLIGVGRDGSLRGTGAGLRLDLHEPMGLGDAVDAARPDAVLHMAVQAYVAASPSETWCTSLPSR